MIFVTFFREILMPKLYDQNQNLADVVSILRDAIVTLHQPNPGPVLAHCSICIVVRSIHQHLDMDCFSQYKILGTPSSFVREIT